MTDTTEVVNTNPIAEWPVGAQIEELDADTWIWTGNRIGGSWLIVHPTRLSSTFYRLLTESELSARFTYLPHREQVSNTLLRWMNRAVHVDLERKRQVEVNNQQRDDWNSLNEMLNEYADNKGMCSEYESQLEDWNGNFTQLTLTGRVKTFEVEVTVRASFTTTITVEATSEDAARDKVEEMDNDEITTDIDMSDAEDLDFDVVNVEAQ